MTTFKYIKMVGKRPCAHTSITSVDNLMNKNEIATEETSLLTLIPLLQDNFGLMQYLTRRRFIRNEILCATCQENCTLPQI